MIENTAATNAHHPRPARILVAEDNQVNRLVALATLARLGFETDTAENGRKALAALENNHYDLVLMDMQMPEMDGIEATRRIREREKSAGDACRLPVIALTANSIEDERERCLAAGMDDYLSKPFSLADLQGTILPWLKRSGITSSNPTGAK